MRIPILLGLLVAGLAAFTAPAPAAVPESDPVERGRMLAESLYRHYQSGRLVLHQRMELIAEGHAARVRELYIYRCNTVGRPAASLIRFSAPADIADTGLLSVRDGAAASDQWVYLPARQMTRRVPAGRQGGRFVGSDFYYEDLRDRHVDLDAHRWLGREVLDGRAVELIESVPVDAGSSVYARRLLWIDTERWLPLRVDFYRRGQSEPGKRYRIIAVERQDGHWVPMESVMEDLSGRHQTRLLTLAWRHGADLPDYLFTRRALEDPAIEAAHRP